ncbi:MAG: DUF1653 domain-containing protein [Oscillospiraceae bacterium]|nr:DUF1653 domain-containing protein [Oscillospiraceae bacterium]
MSLTPDWVKQSAIYHIYPLGFCGCERTRAEHSGEPTNRISKVISWIPHLKALNINAVYFGPLFESTAHGYDTIDYKMIDARLGTNDDFTAVCNALHESGIRVILDGVFNHVGRDHFAFKDVRANKGASQYCSWFCNLNFNGNSAYNDGFWYEGWNNCYDLVKLNLRNTGVVEYLLDAVKYWIDTWHIDGIRFDAADCLDTDFIKRIHSFTKGMKPDFWLMGEIIHGDYRRWANPEMFDSVTNYQCYKGIYSSHNDRNYFEIAHSIEYQLGQYGDTYMYNFVDNHDVARLASQLKDINRIYCCYTLLYTMHGVPSVYYGSEFGIKGEKGHGADADLAIRPCLELGEIPGENDILVSHISALGAIRREYPALQSGSYKKLELKNQTFLYQRELNGQKVYIALNIGDDSYTFSIPTDYKRLADRLSGKHYDVSGGRAEVTVPKNKSAILVDGKDVTPAVKPTETVKPAAASIPVEQVKPVKEEVIPTPPAPKAEAAPVKQQSGTPSLGVPQGREIVIGGKYRHFKGGEYLVLNVARDTETFGLMAVYMQLSGQQRVWVRPLDMFLEDVDDHGNRKPRFEYIGKMDN